jgi:DNA-binding transcriptional MerR regulator
MIKKEDADDALQDYLVSIIANGWTENRIRHSIVDFIRKNYGDSRTKYHKLNIADYIQSEKIIDYEDIDIDNFDIESRLVLAILKLGFNLSEISKMCGLTSCAALTTRLKRKEKKQVINQEMVIKEIYVLSLYKKFIPQDVDYNKSIAEISSIDDFIRIKLQEMEDKCFTNVEMAKELGCSARTIRTYKKRFKIII